MIGPITQRLMQYGRLMRFHKPIGILLLLWPTLWGLWIAKQGVPDLKILVVFILGVIVMRAAGCVINDIFDKKFDGAVMRTQSRPLAAGNITTTEAVALFIFLCSIAFILVLQLNRLTIWLSFAALALACCYPLMKRVTHLPQLLLGVAFSWGIPMAFAAQTGRVPAVAWLVLLTNVLWTTAYDTAYAMTDREDDLKIGVKSTAILFGRYDFIAFSLLQLSTLTLLLLIGLVEKMHSPYFGGIAVAALFATYQQALVKTRLPEKCFKAFLNNAWIGIAVFIGIFINY